MTDSLWWRSVVPAVAVVAAAVVVALPAPRPVAAAAPDLPPELRKVPADAAIFAHVDVEALWKSKLGESLQAAKIRDLERALAEVKTDAGVTPDMVKTAGLFFPQLKQPGDFQSACFLVTFRRPYDKAVVLAGIKKQFANGGQVKETEPGVFDVYAAVPKGPPVPEQTDKDAKPPVKKDDAKDKPAVPDLTFWLADPTRIMVFGKGNRKYLKDQPADATGPIAEAIRAAADGTTGVAGINFANLPDELRGEEIPAEVRPFKPLFTSDAMIATGKLTGDVIKLDLRFRSADKSKVADAEKSLAAGATLLQTLLGVAIDQLEKSKKEDEKVALPLAKAVLGTLKSAKVSATGGEAVASAELKTDLPFAPFLQAQFGGGSAVGMASERAITQNNLKQIGLAMHNYHDVYNGFPPASLVDRKGKPLLSWRVMILPYIEQDQLYKQFKLDEAWDSPHNKAVLDKHPMPKVYALPGVTKDGEKTTHFHAPTGKDTIFDPIQATKMAQITDGTSNTILIVLGAKAVPWTKPEDTEFDGKADPRTLLHYQGAGTSIALADGSVRFIVKTIAEETLKAFLTKAGGEVFDPDNE